MSMPMPSLQTPDRDIDEMVSDLRAALRLSRAPMGPHRATDWALDAGLSRGIVALEAGSGFVFPEDALPAPMPSAAGELAPEAIPADDFAKLTQIPIVIYYGDNIPDAPTAERGKDNWRVRLDMAQLWVAEINKRGGDATLVHLPDEGITGGTHFLMSDLNNTQIADHIAGWLSDKKLDQ